MTSQAGAPVLRLYVAGAGDQSLRAIRAVRSCATALGPGTRTEVIDAYQDIDRADADGVVVLPTAVWCDGEGVHRILGDPCDAERLLAAVSAATNGDRADDGSDHGAKRT